MSKHATELDLAAIGELPFFRRMAIERHVKNCEACQERLAGYAALRAELLEMPEPELDWNRLAAEMRANIHLGIEAGECVREAAAPRFANPGLIAAFASLLVLVGAAVVMQRAPSGNVTANRSVADAHSMPLSDYRVPVLQSSAQGIEMRSGPASFAFLNRENGPVNQVVSADGAVRSHDIDGDTGAVTIRDVYLQ